MARAYFPIVLSILLPGLTFFAMRAGAQSAPCVASPQVDTGNTFSAYASLERLEVRSGKVGAADWEWGLGINTQSAGQFVNINNIDWSNGVPIKYVLTVDGTGVATIALLNASTNAALASKTYSNAAAPFRVGNALRLYVKASSGLGTAKVASALHFANGALSVPITLSTLGDNLYGEAAAIVSIPAGVANQPLRAEGTVTLTWPGSMPTGSRLNMTLQAGNVTCPGPVNAPPTVSLVTPADSSIVKTPAYPVIEAMATDTDGSVQKVEFFAGTLSIGTVTQSPYKIIWRNPAPGTYAIIARATDDKGATADTPTRQLTIELDPVDAPIVNAIAGIKAALIANDISTAASYFKKSERERFTAVLTRIAPQAQSLFSSMSLPQRNSSGNGFLEYAINRTINGKNYLFFVYFVQDEDGIWRIESM